LRGKACQVVLKPDPEKREEFEEQKRQVDRENGMIPPGKGCIKRARGESQDKTSPKQFPKRGAKGKVHS